MKKTPTKKKDEAEKEPGKLTYEKPEIILEEKIEGRAGVCNQLAGGKSAPPCGFLQS